MRCFLLLWADVVVKDVVNAPAVHHLQLSKHRLFFMCYCYHDCVCGCLDVGMRDVSAWTHPKQYVRCSDDALVKRCARCQHGAVITGIDHQW